MFVLMIRGLTLPGAMNGVKFYVLPDWSRLMDAQVSFTLVYKNSFSNRFFDLKGLFTRNVFLARVRYYNRQG